MKVSCTVLKTNGVGDNLVEFTKFLTTSDAEAIAIPHFYRKATTVLARQQRKLARLEKGSNNYQKQANKVARLHLHIAQQRKDFHYLAAHYLCTTYDLIGFEKLNIKGLARTRLAKSILDVREIGSEANALL